MCECECVCVCANKTKEKNREKEFVISNRVYVIVDCFGVSLCFSIHFLLFPSSFPSPHFSFPPFFPPSSFLTLTLLTLQYLPKIPSHLMQSFWIYLPTYLTD